MPSKTGAYSIATQRLSSDNRMATHLLAKRSTTATQLRHSPYTSESQPQPNRHAQLAEHRVRVLWVSVGYRVCDECVTGEYRMRLEWGGAVSRLGIKCGAAEAQMGFRCMAFGLCRLKNCQQERNIGWARSVTDAGYGRFAPTHSG